MDIRNKTIFRALLGFSIGLLMGAVITICLADYEDFSSRWFLLAQLIGSGINGAVCMAGSSVYDLESWSLMKATVIHFLIVMTSIFTSSELLGWFPHEIFLITFLSFTAGYFLVWLFNYLLWKKRINQLNSQLHAMQIKHGSLTE